MVGFYFALVLLILSCALYAQSDYLVPVFNSVQGDQGYSYPDLVSKVSDNSTVITSKAENETLLGEYGRPSTQDRSQAASGGYWLGNPDLHYFSKVSVHT